MIWRQGFVTLYSWAGDVLILVLMDDLAAKMKANNIKALIVLILVLMDDLAAFSNASRKLGLLCLNPCSNG